MASLHKSLLTATRSACEDGSGLSSSQMKVLFKLAIVAIRRTQRIDCMLCHQIWQPDSWRALRGRLESSRFKSSPGLQKMCEQLVGLVQATSSTLEVRAPRPTKRKAIQIQEDTVSQVKKPKWEAKAKET